MYSSPRSRRIGTVIMCVAFTSVLSIGSAGASTGSGNAGGKAPARGGCLVKICGSVMNESGDAVWAIKDFDSDGPKPGTEWRRLNPGQQTPSDQDWDGFYVACKASGRIATWTFPGYWLWRDFSLNAGWWMKIHTDQDAHVRSQSC